MASPGPLSKRLPLGIVSALFAFCVSSLPPLIIAQRASDLEQAGATIQGKVSDASGKPAIGALVKLEPSSVASGAANQASVLESTTDAHSSFSFFSLLPGTYTVTASKAALRSHPTTITVPSRGHSQIDIVLEPQTSAAVAGSLPQSQAMQFSDTPNFTVAGVTDWTAVGGHGSDTTLRTSEDLARQVTELAPTHSDRSPIGSGKDLTEGETEARLRGTLAADPKSYAPNHALGEYYLRTGRYLQAVPPLETASEINHEQADDEYDLALACRGVGDFKQSLQHVQHALAKKDNASLHRLEGDLDEKLGDPLGAVQQQELAVQLDPSEDNFFAWGTELLVHRAVWQATAVFMKGAKAYPGSARLLTAWGTALFADARYEEAAQRLCEASDLRPGDTQIYLFMGKIEMAAPGSLSCIAHKLEDFAQVHPDNATSNYLYAMVLLKEGQSKDSAQAKTLLTRAVSLDSNLAEAYLQLGIISAAEHNYPAAVDLYHQAIQANAQLAEAHYRLGITYDRLGETAKAKQEFEVHDALEKSQADAVEQQRREVKQFLIVLQGQPTYARTH